MPDRNAMPHARGRPAHLSLRPGPPWWELAGRARLVADGCTAGGRWKGSALPLRGSPLARGTLAGGLVETTLWSCGATFAAFAHAERPSAPLQEFPAVLRRGANATAEPAALMSQWQRYAADAGFRQAEASGRNRMLDGSLLIRDVQGATAAAVAARKLGCAWLRAYTEGSDRDQPAFAYALHKTALARCAAAGRACGVRCGQGFLHLMPRNLQAPSNPPWVSNVSICGLSARFLHGRRQRCPHH